MIDIELEKQKTFTSQDYFDILNFAIDLAESNGFVNSYIFERAIYMYASVIAFPDRQEEITSMIAENPLDCWDALIKDGTLETLHDEFSLDINYLEDYANEWYEEYKEYALSARALFGTIQEFSSDIVEQASKQLKSAVSDKDIAEVTRIAEDWGMNNNIPTSGE